MEMKIKIITDSAADFTEKEAEKYAVTIIPQSVIFQGETEVVADREIFWKKLIGGGVAQTSQPSCEMFEKEFLLAKEEGYALVCVFISSALSGTYSSAAAVKKQIGYDEIYIVDAKAASASMAEKLLVLEACKLRDSGVAAAEIFNKLEKMKGHVRLLAYMDTLKYLARGGRIKQASAVIGTILNIKPLITFTAEGNVAVYSKTIGMAQAVKKIIEKVKSEALSREYPVIPIFSYKEENCRKFIAKLKECGIETEERMLTGIGSTIGSHIGPNAFGLVYVVE